MFNIWTEPNLISGTHTHIHTYLIGKKQPLKYPTYKTRCVCTNKENTEKEAKNRKKINHKEKGRKFKEPHTPFWFFAFFRVTPYTLKIKLGLGIKVVVFFLLNYTEYGTNLWLFRISNTPYHLYGHHRISTKTNTYTTWRGKSTQLNQKGNNFFFFSVGFSGCFFFLDRPSLNTLFRFLLQRV